MFNKNLKNIKPYITSDRFTNQKSKMKILLDWNESTTIFSKDFEKEMIGWFGQKATKGPETFRLMYEKMGFEKSVWFSRLPVVRTVFDAGYYIFAYGIRPCLPRTRK